MIAFPKEIINHIKSFIPRDDSFKSRTAAIINEYLLYMKDANYSMINCRRFNPPPINLYNSFPEFILSCRGKRTIKHWYEKSWYVKRKIEF